MAVGGSGVEVGAEAVGVFGLPKREAQALNPKANNAIKIRLRKSFLIRSGRRVLGETSVVLYRNRGLKNIVWIIPMKNPSPILGEGLG